MPEKLAGDGVDEFLWIARQMRGPEPIAFHANRHRHHVSAGSGDPVVTVSAPASDLVLLLYGRVFRRRRTDEGDARRPGAVPRPDRLAASSGRASRCKKFGTRCVFTNSGSASASSSLGRGSRKAVTARPAASNAAEIALDRPVLHPEMKDPAAPSFHVEHVLHRLQVLAHVERAVLVAGDEEPARDDRVQDADAQRAAGREHARELGDRAVEILDVHEHHEAHDDVGDARRRSATGRCRRRRPASRRGEKPRPAPAPARHRTRAPGARARGARGRTRPSPQPTSMVSRPGSGTSSRKAGLLRSSYCGSERVSSIQSSAWRFPVIASGGAAGRSRHQLRVAVQPPGEVGIGQLGDSRVVAAQPVVVEQLAPLAARAAVEELLVVLPDRVRRVGCDPVGAARASARTSRPRPARASGPREPRCRAARPAAASGPRGRPSGRRSGSTRRSVGRAPSQNV